MWTGSPLDRQHALCAQVEQTVLVEWLPWSCFAWISLWASFKNVSWFFHWYNTTMKRSRILNLSHWLSIALNGVIAMLLNAFVAYGKHFHASHADFFPFPKNAGTLPQPMKLWNTGMADEFSLSKTWATVMLWMFKWCFPVSKATH